MKAASAGFAFFIAAVLIVLFFFIDQLVFSGARERARLDEAEPVPYLDEDALDAGPMGIGVGAGENRRFPTPDDFTLDFEDEDLLSSDEWNRILRGDNYEYTVDDGDSISGLAKKYLGDAKLAEKIYEANPGLRDHGMRPGDRLVIPLAERR